MKDRRDDEPSFSFAAYGAAVLVTTLVMIVFYLWVKGC